MNRCSEGYGLNRHHVAALVLAAVLLFQLPACCFAENEVLTEEGEVILPPQYPVFDYVEWLLETARKEIGEGEDSRGRTKYGIWAGVPDAEWCAEFLCWCVDQVDKQHGTQLLKKQYPLYSASNVGKNWFIREGRYISRTGFVSDWGSQWLIGSENLLQRNEYIPQPGDWVFFSVNANKDTSHVALVEFCTVDSTGAVKVHVIEGNNPDKVARRAYPIDNWAILGYGTVRDLADFTLRTGNEGVKVTALQEKLSTIGYLEAQYITGKFARITCDAVKRFQKEHGIQETGVAGHETLLKLDEAVRQYYHDHPEIWSVVDE